MRLQLARPENTFLGPDLYNQLFTMHGTTMMFLFAVPVMEGMGLYLVPLMVGTRNVAFPRLIALRLLDATCSAACCCTSRLLLNTGPDVGWFSYVPLAGPDYSPGKRVDVWAQMITFTEIGALVGAVEIIATVVQACARPGMSLNRMPLFVWAHAGHVVHGHLRHAGGDAVRARCSSLDRLRRHALLQPGRGRRRAALAAPVLVLRPPRGLHHLPAGDWASSRRSSPTFTRRPMFGYTAMVLSLIATGVHRRSACGCTTCSPRRCRSSAQSFFTAASMMIAIPNGVQIFCWIATLWGGRAAASRRRCSSCSASSPSS